MFVYMEVINHDLWCTTWQIQAGIEALFQDIRQPFWTGVWHDWDPLSRPLSKSVTICGIRSVSCVQMKATIGGKISVFIIPSCNGTLMWMFSLRIWDPDSATSTWGFTIHGPAYGWLYFDVRKLLWSVQSPFRADCELKILWCLPTSPLQESTWSWYTMYTWCSSYTCIHIYDQWYKNTLTPPPKKKNRNVEKIKIWSWTQWEGTVYNWPRNKTKSILNAL